MLEQEAETDLEKDTPHWHLDFEVYRFRVLDLGFRVLGLGFKGPFATLYVLLTCSKVP